MTGLAGYIIPDTRRDQTWATSNIAAASYLKRNSLNINYAESKYNFETSDQRNINNDFTSLNQSGAHTVELNVSGYNVRQTGSSYKNNNETKVNLAYSYLINEKVSLGSYWDYSSEYDQNSYLGSVWKKDANTYIGMRISELFASNTDRGRQYLIGYGKRYEEIDYEITISYAPNIASYDNDSHLVTLGVLSVWRLQNWELQSTYTMYKTEIDENSEKLSTTAHQISVRPEYEVIPNYFVGATFSYLLGKKTYKDNSTDVDYTLDENYQTVGLFLRSILNGFQLYASYISGDYNRDYSHRTSNDNFVGQSLNLKVSYLF